MEAKSTLCRIGEFEFDTRTHSLKSGKHEQHLGQNEGRFLTFLIDNFRDYPEHTNDQLKRFIWGVSNVENSSLYQSFHILKEALGPTGAKYLRTRPYHLVVEPIRIGSPKKDQPPRRVFDPWLFEKTYYRYQKTHCPLLATPELVTYLEKRHGCTALRLGSMPVPATIIWSNVNDVIPPDQILGTLDFAGPVPLSSSPVLPPSEYAVAREFIREQYESGPIKYEGNDYCMTKIDRSGRVPKIDGAFGLYYDNILTQYAIEWELKKALLGGDSGSIDLLLKRGALPLREAVEAAGDPLLFGFGRSAALSISTFLIFKRSLGNWSCLIRKRSMDVGVSPGILHVVPAGMFEAHNTNDNWSVELNVWRELLEELYGDQELVGGSPLAELPDHIIGREPVRLLHELLEEGKAEFSVTGIICDLLNLRPEICTVLFISDPRFAEARVMKVNWEYEPELRAGKFAVNWDRIDEVIENDGMKYGIAAGGAACIALGREWARRRHHM